MKLVYRILLHLLWVLTLLLAGWAALFYFTLIDEVNDEVDDALEARAEVIVKRVLAGRELPETSTDGNTGYYLHEVSAEYAEGWAHERYTDEEIYIPERDDEEPARVLRQTFRDASGRWYELTVMTPSIEKEDLLEAIFYGILYLYLFLLLSVLLVTVVVVNRMMRPLYALLRWLDDYRIGRPNAPLVVETSVTEFRRLNDAAVRSAQRAESSFERQKQFIGNASHEMQTPLAVCRNRLEMLVDDPQQLSEEQLGEIAKVQHTLDYLVRLNRTLLLLSKIDNGQFPEVEEIDLGGLTRRTGEDLEEIYAYRGLRFVMEEQAPLRVRMNPSLAGSLVGNLIKNAFVHGAEGGEVRVRISARRFEVENSADAGPLDAAHIFDRFYQGTKKKGSTGLGLAIVDAVCRLYGLRIRYDFRQGLHCFTVDFPA
ncbi:two-component sensor histidine kinase [Alistipes sp. An116]|uniref:sensor histidine kinase n=1 Tax=Alistipes sp. An116 TaxID=1965546 RepID=UPI000B3940AD|nr:HAMP domain-containing sensor histidine kinase [Alistipes sp. An116]OUQ53442.1 two-component sensor histidine kinase [Alistipes sp. An116]